jgi:hypothetical protein
MKLTEKQKRAIKIVQDIAKDWEITNELTSGTHMGDIWDECYQVDDTFDEDKCEADELEDALRSLLIAIRKIGKQG